MLLDFAEADADIDLSADVCIIGAGAAGITVARALLKDGAEVVLHAHVPGLFLPDPGTLVSVSVDERQVFVFTDD